MAKLYLLVRDLEVVMTALRNPDRRLPMSDKKPLKLLKSTPTA